MKLINPIKVCWFFAVFCILSACVMKKKWNLWGPKVGRIRRCRWAQSGGPLSWIGGWHWIVAEKAVAATLFGSRIIYSWIRFSLLPTSRIIVLFVPITSKTVSINPIRGVASAKCRTRTWWWAYRCCWRICRRRPVRSP